MTVFRPPRRRARAASVPRSRPAVRRSSSSVPLALLALISLVQLPKEVGVDTWLALVTGRLITDSRDPASRDADRRSPRASRGSISSGSRSSLSYGIDRLGGLGLLGLVNCALLVGSVAVAVRTARASGAPFRAVLITLPVCVAMVMPSREVRTQAFAVPLFALLVGLLAADSRAAVPTRLLEPAAAGALGQPARHGDDGCRAGRAARPDHRVAAPRRAAPQRPAHGPRPPR